jgi:transcriptional regulator with XRE-family HTH domain
MNLTDIRKNKNIRMIDLAARIGISQGYYSNLERGKRPFNDTLLRKTAKELGVSLNILREATKNNPTYSYKLNSWMSNIRINGLPLIKAFQYYIETYGLQLQISDDVTLRKKMKEFVEANIGYSVLAELSENKLLLDQVREKIGLTNSTEKKGC